MALKKSELYSSIWSSCDELRGGMDASQYKDYVLVLLFVKYISDKYAGQPYAPIQVPKGASFAGCRTRLQLWKSSRWMPDACNFTEPSLVIDSIDDAIWAKNDLTNIVVPVLGNTAT